MLKILFENDLMWTLLVCFTIMFIWSDRAFPRKKRFHYYIALLFCFLLSLLGERFFLADIVNVPHVEFLLIIVDALLRPIIPLTLLGALDDFSGRTKWLLPIPYVINLLLVATNSVTGAFLAWNSEDLYIPGPLHLIPYLTFAFYLLLVSLLSIKNAKNFDHSAFFFIGFINLTLILALVSEGHMYNSSAVNQVLCLSTCIMYFFSVINTYKKDALTGLLMRHNLNYELSDLEDCLYDIVLIDIDNFKLINDKYGHDQGDIALVTVVDTIRSELPKHTKMYRYGGDEFIILSTHSEKESIADCLVRSNQILEEKDFHISYGICTHEPGVPTETVLLQADKNMYENKRALKSESIWDDMTGLYNYKGFLEELDTFRKSTLRDQHQVFLIGIDIEHLSNINMAYGYTEGNELIAALARVIKTCLRGRDFIGHLGSDEFIVALEIKNEEDTYPVDFMTNVIETMDGAYELASKDYNICLNFGKLLVNTESEATSEELVNTVLYTKQEDKDNRRKNDISADEQDYNNQDEQLVLDIIEHNKLKYAFQPIVSARDGEIIAYEALMRSDTETMVSPLKILRYAARNKLTSDVERLTFNNVFEAITSLPSFPKDRRIFINSIPGHWMNDTEFTVFHTKYGDWFSRMVVEITEQRELTEEELVLLNTRRSDYDFHIAVDDYGSGCSNTNSLLRYTPEVIKLDRLLITGIDRNSKKQFFVKSIITFAKENDMLILAEGVETSRELRTVIRLGVDLIQGYYTAKPAFELLDQIPEDIKKEIINENIKVGSSNVRRIYTAGSDGELSLMHLAMEDYTKINVTTPKLTIRGSSDYTADMCINIKDGLDCTLTLEDVLLDSLDDLPCIVVGEGASLTLRVIGENRLNGLGIHVPENSSFVLKGNGNLEINAKGHSCYGIGASYEEPFGSILLQNSGSLNVSVDGDLCIGIGGGIAGEHSKIDIASGNTILNVAGVNAAGIGCVDGDVPINIHECSVKISFRVNTGSAIGSVNGKQFITMHNFEVTVEGSGRNVSALGSTNSSAGKIEFLRGSLHILLSGHVLHMIGIQEGPLIIDMLHVRFDAKGEGDEVLAYGSQSRDSIIHLKESSSSIIINASCPLVFGSKDRPVLNEENIVINGSKLPKLTASSDDTSEDTSENSSENSSNDSSADTIVDSSVDSANETK